VDLESDPLGKLVVLVGVLAGGEDVDQRFSAVAQLVDEPLHIAGRFALARVSAFQLANMPLYLGTLSDLTPIAEAIRAQARAELVNQLAGSVTSRATSGFVAHARNHMEQGVYMHLFVRKQI
jgi:hypothetical protein